MNPPIKKLAVIFLIGAIVTSSLALSVSAIINRMSVKSGAAQPGLAPADSYKIYGAGPNGQNLTDEVVSIYAHQLVTANPEGPKQNQDGTVQFLAPGDAELLSYLTANLPPESVLTPPLEDSRIKVLQDFDEGDLLAYLSAVTQIQSDLESDPVWQIGLDPNATSTDVSTGNVAVMSEAAFTSARDKMYALKVPAPLEALHRSTLASLSTLGSFSHIVMNDPVAAVALSKNMDAIIAKQGDDAEQAAKELQASLPGLISKLPQEDRSAIAILLGVYVAHAQFVVTDPPHIAVTIASWLKDFWFKYGDIIKSYALGFLKNKLVQLIGKKVIAWAQGEGVPGYVTNWLIYEVDAGLSAKFGLINREVAKACGNAATTGLYGDVLASALGAPNWQLGVTGVNQTVGETPGCPPVSSGFYGRGGYSAENFLMSLQYNTLNDIINIGDASIRAAGAASQAAVNEALAGRGSLDVKKCDDGTAVDNEGRCADGSYARTITQGSTKQDLISKTVGATIDTITAANNEHTYAAIVAVLENALLNYLWKEGEGLFQNSSSRGGTTPPPPTGTSLEGQLRWYADQLESALSKTNGAISNYQQAVSILRGSLDVCGEDSAGPILDAIDTFNAAVTRFTAEAERIQGLLDTVHAFQASPSSHTQAELDSRVGTTASITALVARATADSNTAQSDTANAIALFQSCPAP
jgi:hypothetical protein